jgi:glycosyltransferase involved in cell wall biosynthesis
MKKVLILSGNHHEIPPTRGAAVQTWIYEVAKRIITFETHIISKSHNFLANKEFKNGVFFHRIKVGVIYRRIFQKILGWDIYSYNDRILKKIKQIQPDIIHIHNYYNIKEIIKKIRIFDKNIKIIMHMHNDSKQFNKKDFPFVDVFIGCSNYITNLYKDKDCIKTDFFTTLYNGVDNHKFNSSIKHKSTIKALTNTAKYNICYFGRVSPEKGVDKILQIAKLLKNDANLQFSIIGEIPTQGGRAEYYQKLIRYQKNNNLTNVKFLDNIVPQKIQLAYQLADLIIIPSLFEEPFCMVAIEAMASKVPTISAYKGGMKEYLIDNKNTMIIADYDNFALIAVEKINDYLKDKKMLDNIINNAHITAKSFDWLKVANQTEKLYNEII